MGAGVCLCCERPALARQGVLISVPLTEESLQRGRHSCSPQSQNLLTNCGVYIFQVQSHTSHWRVTSISLLLSAPPFELPPLSTHLEWLAFCPAPFSWGAAGLLIQGVLHLLQTVGVPDVSKPSSNCHQLGPAACRNRRVRQQGSRGRRPSLSTLLYRIEFDCGHVIIYF